MGILSIVQGITELLPISSSGHLILVEKLFNFDTNLNSVYLSVLHLGTTLAIILFYRKYLFENFFTKEKWLFFLKILIASIPAGILGFTFEKYINQYLYNTTTISITLIVVGIMFIIFENIKLKTLKVDIENIPFVKILIIGITQSLALIPGVSRSGITTLSGMSLGLEKYTSFNFSFILGIPILLGASIYEILKSYFEISNRSIDTLLLTGIKVLPTILLTFTLGYLSLLLVKRFNKRKWLTVFGVYRILLGILIILLAI